MAVREKELEEAKADLRVLEANDLAELREAELVAEKELEEAKGRLALLVAGTRRETIEATRETIARLEAQHEFLEAQIQALDVVTPIAGIVTTPKMKDKVGQLIRKGDLIANVHNFSTVRAEILVPEKEIADVKAGQRVTLKARAYPGRLFEGQVALIASAATPLEDRPDYRIVLVTAELDNAALELKPAMTGHAKIYCGKRRLLDLTTRRWLGLTGP